MENTKVALSQEESFDFRKFLILKRDFGVDGRCAYKGDLSARSGLPSADGQTGEK